MFFIPELFFFQKNFNHYEVWNILVHINCWGRQKFHILKTPTLITWTWLSYPNPSLIWANFLKLKCPTIHLSEFIWGCWISIRARSEQLLQKMIEIFLKTFREDQYSCIQNKITLAFFQVSSLLIFSVFIFMIIFLLDWVFINEKKKTFLCLINKCFFNKLTISVSFSPGNDSFLVFYKVYTRGTICRSKKNFYNFKKNWRFI